MNQKIRDLVSRIGQLEDENEAELAARRALLHVTMDRHRVRFEREILEQHRHFKTGLFEYLRHARLRHAVSAPIVYGMILPLLVVDLSITIYQFTCFPLYRIPRVRRSEYFAFDRDSLAYLNLLEKFNCTYCAYANGLAAYVKQIIGLTEQYWCPSSMHGGFSVHIPATSGSQSLALPRNTERSWHAFAGS